MTTEGLNRKLTAILSADAVGYSRLMAADEVDTFQRLKSYRELINVRVREHHGRVVDLPGDNLIAEFPSALDAVRCAFEIQQALKNRNADLPDDRKMEFRIGIHLGDVMVDGDRIYGDGVNIAARLEGLADPGGICISGIVHDQVKAKLDLNYQDRGSQKVKNIPDPVRIYNVMLDYTKTPHREIKAKTDVKKAWRNISLIVLAMIIVSIASILIRLTPQKDAPTVNVATPLNTVRPVEKPSIAVLPFDNISSDPDQEYFADGMTEEIITKLSKSPQLFVIARNSTFTYKGKPIKVQLVSQELGARYVVEGSVRRAGNRMRITAQMIDALTGNYLLSETYNRKYNINEIFNIQDEISQRIAGAVSAGYRKSELQRVKRIPTENLNAYDSYWRALEFYNQRIPESRNKARKLLEQAIDLDPNFAEAYALLGNIYWRVRWEEAEFNPQEAINRSIAMAKKALDIDETNCRSLRLLAEAHAWNGQRDQAISYARRAISLDPNNADGHNAMGIVLIWIGEYEEAIIPIEKAIRLNPYYPANYDRNLGLAHFYLGRYEEAIKCFHQALSKNSNYLSVYNDLSLAYHHAWTTQQIHNPQYLTRSIESAKKAVTLISSSSWANSQLGYAYLFNKQYQQAIAQAKKALVLSPDDPIMRATMGHILNHTGRPEEAIELLEKTDILITSVPVTSWLLSELGGAYYLTGRYDDAVATLIKGLFDYNPGFDVALRGRLRLIFAYIELGRMEEARAEAAEILKMSPNFSVDTWGERVPYQDQEFIQRCMAAMRKAGLK